MKGKSGRNQLCLLEIGLTIFFIYQKQVSQPRIKRSSIPIEIIYVEKFNQNNMGFQQS